MNAEVMTPSRREVEYGRELLIAWLWLIEQNGIPDCMWLGDSEAKAFVAYLEHSRHHSTKIGQAQEVWGWQCAGLSVVIHQRGGRLG